MAPEDVQCREAPDFFVRVAGQIVGIELVEYSQAASSTRGFPQREVEGTWIRFRDQARAASRSSPELQGVDIFLHFDPIELPPRPDWPAFLEEIGRFVNDHRRDLVAKPTEYGIPARGFPLMQRHLSELGLAVVGDLADWGWNGDVGYIGLAGEELRSIFARKVAMQYERADQLWLLVHGGTTIGSMLSVLDSAIEGGAISEASHELHGGPFDRVLLWSPFHSSPTYEWTRARGWRVAETITQS